VNFSNNLPTMEIDADVEGYSRSDISHLGENLSHPATVMSLIDFSQIFYRPKIFVRLFLKFYRLPTIVLSFADSNCLYPIYF
jgi:hypothetical protein